MSQPSSPRPADRFGFLKVARRIRGFRKERRGVAAVEFVLLAPFMIGLWLGSFELSQAVSADRKVSHAASALADLVTQQPNVTTDELDNIMDATRAIMMPFDADNLAIEIAGVRIDDDSNTEIRWSTARDSSEDGPELPEPGEAYPIPASLLVPNSFLVVAQLAFEHESPVSRTFTSITLTDAFYLRPRRSQEITCSDCNG